MSDTTTWAGGATDVRPGDRVEIHHASSYWARGLRSATVLRERSVRFLGPEDEKWRRVRAFDVVFDRTRRDGMAIAGTVHAWNVLAETHSTFTGGEARGLSALAE